MKQLTREEKISEIYEKIANKELSLGCRVILTTNRTHGKGAEFTLVTINDYSDGYSDLRIDSREYMFYREGYNTKELRCFKKEDFEIKGHPVMISYVLDWLYHNFPEESPYDKITWDYFRKPIDDQTDKTIDFIHSLL